MRPILALNCLLQIEQERSEEESSVGDALALPFRCARWVDVQAGLSLCWSYRSYCRFYHVLDHFLFTQI